MHSRADAYFVNAPDLDSFEVHTIPSVLAYNLEISFIINLLDLNIGKTTAALIVL